MSGRFLVSKHMKHSQNCSLVLNISFDNDHKPTCDCKNMNIISALDSNEKQFHKDMEVIKKSSFKNLPKLKLKIKSTPFSKDK